jgi:hypothetical protein
MTIPWQPQAEKWLRDGLKAPEHATPCEKCMIGTREDVLYKITTWLQDFDTDTPNILWLHGSPGAGKSVIASTVMSSTEQCQAWFFFRKDESELKDPNRVWRRIAGDLAEWNPDVKSRIVRALEERKANVKDMDIMMQFQQLIANPLMETDGKTLTEPALVVIDALDECDSYDAQFLQTLTCWSKLHKRYKLMVTSRDYTSIRQSLGPISHDIELHTGADVTSQTSDDLRRFITSGFNRIAKLHSQVLPPDWPGPAQINQLVQSAAGLFIWARAVLDFVQQGDPVERLSLISTNDWEGVRSVDLLYQSILEAVLEGLIWKEHVAFYAVTGSIVLAKNPLSLTDLQHLLGLSPTLLQAIINGLSPVLAIGGQDQVLRVCHQSFADYLLDSDRSKTLTIDITSQSINLAKGCLQILNQELRFNLCNLETSHSFNHNIPNHDQHVKDMISSTVQHASCYWADYLDTITGTGCDAMILTAMEDFLYIHLLHWLEVLSLISAFEVAPGLLLKASKWVSVSGIFNLN